MNEISDYKHPLYLKFAPLWQRVRDACEGQEAVKARGETYLPSPDESEEDRKRYKRYLERATYYNATGRTLSGLVGIAFATWPKIETTDAELLGDADGSGVGLINQSQTTLSDVLQTGRAGILVDYTASNALRSEARTIAAARAAGSRPWIINYSAEQILDWEHSGASLKRVVLQECKEERSGGEVKPLSQLRELEMVDGSCVIRVWVQHTPKGKFLLDLEVATKLPFIPFAFVGAINNDSLPDLPPLMDLADLNLAHWRNSADFEESAFLHGQAQLVITGATEEWRQANGGGIKFGARSAIVLDSGADAKLLQVAPNTMAQMAMKDKEEKMQALGARLVTPTRAAITATQSASETKAAYSPLSLACDNVSDAYTKALRWASAWIGREVKDSFSIDTRFNDLALDANAIRETVAAWQAGIVPKSDAIAVLQRLGAIDEGKTVEQVSAEIESEGPPLNLDEAA
ncbi:DUF4055 domain-containing protein [Lysobacter enzymogenes]|uniref:DUF4055 domain-containing protein n=1 Tax=Lysobacter enzymogenes TaxID=69 RepID=UPI001A979BD7|nr:DUF4055 domain-containing protein [Lysobacter enzymogenes]QQP97930.1 DUF4055 domain-containing protein [Lysobacter enzymogenes]